MRKELPDKMSKTNNIIEINGRRFDAKTGVSLSGGAAKARPANIDGVKSTRSSVASAQSIAPQTPQKQPRQAAKNASTHQPEPTKTLMRGTVRKPVVAPKSNIKAKGQKKLATRQPQAELSVKLSVQKVDQQKLEHARKVRRSQQIKRFNSTPVVGLEQFTPVSPQTPAVIATVPPAPTQQVPRQAKTIESLLDNALVKATAHQQKAPKAPRKTRRLAITGISAAAVLLLAVVGYQNFGKVTMLQASAKAGFSASLPAYRPAGYSLGNVASTTGQITINFHSNSSDSRHYTLTEKPSDWDSSTLRDQFVASADPNYQTVETNGQTIYLYGNGNATWVNQGKQYTIQSDGSLSNKQLVSLATSL